MKRLNKEDKQELETLRENWDTLNLEEKEKALVCAAGYLDGKGYSKGVINRTLSKFAKDLEKSRGE